MSNRTDERIELEVRAGLGINPTHSVWPEDAQALLRLLDAERARADAAEAKVARVRGYAEMSAIAAHAVGNGSEERTLLDLLHLLELNPIK